MTKGILAMMDMAMHMEPMCRFPHVQNSQTRYA